MTMNVFQFSLFLYFQLWWIHTWCDRMFTPRFWIPDKPNSGAALFSKTAHGHWVNNSCNVYMSYVCCWGSTTQNVGVWLSTNDRYARRHYYTVYFRLYEGSVQWETLKVTEHNYTNIKHYVYWLTHSVELRLKEIAPCSQKRQHPTPVNGQN